MYQAKDLACSAHPSELLFSTTMLVESPHPIVPTNNLQGTSLMALLKPSDGAAHLRIRKSLIRWAQHEFLGLSTSITDTGSLLVVTVHR